MVDYDKRWTTPKTNPDQSTDLSKGFKSQWITGSIDKDFIDYAEKIGKELVEGKLTTSKIRNIYSEIKRIHIQVSKGNNFDENSSIYASFLLLKAKVAYTQGRDKDNNGVKLFKAIFDTAWNCVVNGKGKKPLFENFCKVMEAIMAYHKSNGGKNN